MPKITEVVGELKDHHHILAKLREAVETKNFSLMVVFPTITLLNTIQDELLNRQELCGIGGVRFLLFEGFITEACQKCGLKRNEPSVLVKDLLVSEALQELSDQGVLDYLGKVPFVASYRQALQAGISEWKRSCLSPETFSAWAADKGMKEKQLALLYQTYQDLLVKRGYTETDLTLIKLIAKSRTMVRSLENTQVILYGFTDLTPLQTKFIETLANQFHFEIITDPTPVPEIQEFIAEHFRGVSIPGRTVSIPGNALSKLQAGFWSKAPEPEPLDLNDESLQLLQTSGWMKEAAGIAREIVNLLRKNHDYRMEDFLVLSPQPQTFIKTATPVFGEYQLPLACTPASIREYPAINRYSQILTVCSEDWLWPEMEVFIRQHYPAELAIIGDRLLLELGERYGALSGRDRWLSLLKTGNFQQYFTEKGLSLIPLQKSIRLLESIPAQALLKDYLKLTRKWLNDAAILKEQQGDSWRYQIDNLQAIQTVVKAMDDLSAYLEGSALFQNQINLKEFQSLWNDYFLSLDLKIDQPSRPAVRVLIPQEARGLQAKVVFITGLEQGVFPRNYINDWKLSLQARRDLKTKRVELETGEQYQLQEKMAFYWALQSAKDHLFLVYQEQDNNGQPLNRSLFLDEILQWFPNLATYAKHHRLAPELPPSLASCYSVFEEKCRWASYLTLPPEAIPINEYQLCRERFQIPQYQRLASQIGQYYRRQSGSRFSFFHHPAATEFLERTFGEEFTFAITALEDYRSCPYRFFLKRLLKIKLFLKPQLLPENLDLGNLYHQVLQAFGDHFRGECLLSERGQEYQSILVKCFHHFYQEWKDNAANDLVRLVLSLQEEQILATLERWLKDEYHWAEESNGRFKLSFFEFGFGLVRGDFDLASVATPYQLEGGATKIRIWGKVDRIDADAEGNFVVYDYKLGRGPSAKDLLDLNYFQIPVYLMALEDLYFGVGKAVGGSYLGLKAPSRSRSGVWRQDRLKVSPGKKSLLTEADWQEWLEKVKTSLIDTVQMIREGKFFPAPKECLPFCEYKDCCRRLEREVELANEASTESTADESSCRI